MHLKKLSRTILKGWGMNSNGSSEKLGNLTTKIGSGATPKGGKESYKKSGIALIRSQNVYNEGFSYQGLAYIDDEQAGRLNNVIVEPKDVLLNITGDSVTRVCQVPDDVLPARVNQHVTIIRPKKGKLDARFLRYFLSGPQMRGYMLQLASAGATRNALTKGMIEDFKIPDLPLKEQKRIGEILGSLDDKIDLNHHMNQTLEEMARAIFKSWFVDFDPVRAKVEGRETGLPAEVADLFPDSFEDSPLGEIPRGWKLGKLDEISENVRKIVNPKDVSTTLPYIGLEHMPQRSISLWEWGVANNVNSSKYKFSKMDILFGKLRPYFHKVGIAPIDGVCSTDILVLKPKINFLYAYLLGIVSSREFVKFTDAGSTGTKMPRTNWNNMGNYDIVIPSKPILENFDVLIRPFSESILRNVGEIKTLTEMRTQLLSRLLNVVSVIP